MFPMVLGLLFACDLFIGTSKADYLVRQFSMQNRWLQLRTDNWFGDPSSEFDGNGCSEREPDQYFAQKLDHSNGSDKNTYWQRYQVNLRYHNSSDQWPVVFLMIGGESQVKDYWVCVERVPMMKMAKEHGAIVVQLEHRFFGKNASSGLGDLSTANLEQLLTSDQALADIASFIPFFNKQYGLRNARWVAFGGSYPGSLAAWLRVKYPELTVGAVAISAPIWPKVDFWEYSATMEKAIEDTDKQCSVNVKAAFSQLAAMLQNDKGKKILSKLYNAEPALSQLAPMDLIYFRGEVFGAWQGTIQFTFDMPIYNVTRACELMAETGKDLQKRLANVFYTLPKRTNFRYDHMIKPYLNESIDADEAQTRAWMWMKCNEFGWFKSTDKENSIFGDIRSLNFYYQRCADLFGKQIGANYVETRVAQSEKKLGNGCTFEASNLIMTNGRFDPWSALGIRAEDADYNGECRSKKQHQADLDKHLLAVWTPGAAHCADMIPAYKGEPIGLKATREKVRFEVKYFLDSALARMQKKST